MNDVQISSFDRKLSHHALLNTFRRIQEVHELLDNAMKKFESILSESVVEGPVSYLPRGGLNIDQADDLRIAKAFYRIRRERSKVLPDRLFGEPAWDMLLDLYVAEREGRDTSISSLCIAASVPGTTALRWIETLERFSLLYKRNDPHDGRRIYVSLTEKGSAALKDFMLRATSML